MSNQRATQAEKNGRVELVIQARIRDISEDAILQMLIKQYALSSRQARRYLDLANEALYREAVENDPVQLGLWLKQAKSVAQRSHKEYLQQDDPDGKALRKYLAASKGCLDVQKFLKLKLKSGGSGHEQSTRTTETQDDGLAEVLHLFG